MLKLLALASITRLLVVGLLTATYAGCESPAPDPPSAAAPDSGTGNDVAGERLEAGSVPLCASDAVSRAFSFRLEPPAGIEAPSGLKGPLVVDLSGTLMDVVLSSEPCARCALGTTPALRLTLATTLGPIWSLIVVPEGAIDQWRASAEAIVGGSVSLRARYDVVFQYPDSSGFVLRTADGIAMAAEAGPWKGVLEPGDLPSFEVTLGADVCRFSGPCGEMNSELVFHGDTDVSVGRSMDGELALGGHLFGARNTGGGYLLPFCVDAEHVSTWSIWRKAP
jgi:hypothetical protein